MVATADLLVRVLADVTDAQKGLSSVDSSTGKMTAGIKKAAVPAAAALAAVGAAAISMGNAAADDAQAAAILATNLKNTTGATDKQVTATESYIDAMAKATGVADDQLRPAMSALARGSGDVTTAQDDLATALDVSVATGKDMQSISEAIAKAYGGNTASLKKLVPTLDDATLAGGDMTAIMAELAKQTGGSAAAAADTAAGKMARATVAMDEAQEEIGTALLPALSSLAGVLASVAGFAQEHPAIFTAVAAAVAVLAAGILILNVAVGVYTAVTTLAGSTTLAAGVAMAAGWFMAALPIMLVVAAVALVVVGIILLWKHSETFRDVVLGVWSAIQTAATETWDAIQGAVEAVFGWVKGNWPKLVAILTGPIGIAVLLIVKHWDTIKGAAETVFSAVKTAVGWVSSAVDTLIGWLGKIKIPDMDNPFTLAKNAIGHVSSALDTMIGWLKDIVIPTGMSTPFDTLKGAVSAVSGAVETLIGWLGKIKVPKINLPHIPGTSRAAPAPAVATGYAAPRVAMGQSSRAVASSGGVTINVTGAVDPEATARQIRRILAGHTMRVGLAT